MTKAAALDYAKKNVRVNVVGPGPVETPLLTKGTGGDPHSYAAFVPMGRIGQPDEIAATVVWLLSDEARYVTGHTLPVDGGVCSQERVNAYWPPALRAASSRFRWAVNFHHGP